MDRRAGAAAVLAFVVLAGFAGAVTAEVVDRRREGFCRGDPAPGTVAFEEPTWWPLGERCHLRDATGATRERRPGWWLTGFVAGSAAAVVSGAVAPPTSARRRLAWALVVPLVPLAALVAATVHPRSLSRLLSLTTIALAYAAAPGALTALVGWATLRGRVLPTVLGSWLAWAAFMFWQGRDAVGP